MNFGVGSEVFRRGLASSPHRRQNKVGGGRARAPDTISTWATAHATAAERHCLPKRRFGLLPAAEHGGGQGSVQAGGNCDKYGH